MTYLIIIGLVALLLITALFTTEAGQKILFILVAIGFIVICIMFPPFTLVLILLALLGLI